MRCEKLQIDETDQTEMITSKVPRWRIKIEEAKEYRDALSQHLLAEWELDIVETQPQPFAQALIESALDNDRGMDKVSRWLQTTSTSEQLDDSKGDADLSLQERIFTQELTATQKTNASKSARKPSKRLKGF
jgi:hypothetical protein